MLVLHAFFSLDVISRGIIKVKLEIFCSCRDVTLTFF
jgi:hypothetical protein